MKDIICVTGNTDKFTVAKAACLQNNVALTQNEIDIDEIQGEDGQLIVEDKAKKAYSVIKKPVVVTDDSWSIVGLKGFPGAYMKSVTHWLSSQDFINLTSSLEDKTTELHQYVAYYDGNELKIFSNMISGKVISSPRGNSGPSWTKVVELEGDGGMTMAEFWDSRGSENSQPEHTRKGAEIWLSFAKWYSEKS